MKTRSIVHSILVCLALGTPAGLVSGASAAEDTAVPELRGMFVMSNARRFALCTPGGAQSGWASLGDSFTGWQLVEYREDTGVLVVQQGDRTAEISLESSHILDADPMAQKATIEEADAVLEKMQFETMFAKLMEQQKASMMKMSQQMLQQSGDAGKVDPVAFAEFQGRVVDTLMEEMDAKQMQADMAQAYSDIFTKGELQGLSEFYSTDAGQAMIEKSPAVQERMMNLMMPRMMRAMPRIQEMGKQFAQQQREAAQQQTSASAGSTP